MTRRLTSSADAPTLSICIPTYNRAPLLRVALAALEREYVLLTLARRQRIEIIISDNASTDGTMKVAAEFVTTHASCAKYLRRAVSIGGDNIYACTDTATGIFVWILSDDDVLLPGALTTLFDTLEAEPALDAVAINVRSLVGTSTDAGPLAFKDWSGQLYRTGDELFREISTMLTFLSILVYRRSLVAGEDYAFASGSELVQAYAYSDVINRGSTFVTIGGPVLAYRLANQGSYDYGRVFVDNYLAVLEYARKGGMAAPTLEHIKRHHLRTHVLMMMLNFKRHGAAGSLRPDWRGTRRRLRRHYRKDPVGRAAVAAVTLLPSPVVTRIEDLVRSVRRRAGR